MTASQSSTQERANLLAQDMVVGVFSSHDQAEQAVHRLIEAGIPADHISLVAQGLEVRERLQGYITTGDVAREGAATGAWAGGLFGLLAGAAFLWVPVLGPLIVVGPLVTAALGAASGGAAGGLLGAIMGRQVEKERIPKYQAAIQAGKVLVVVHGTPEETEKARRIMGENNSEDVATYGVQAA